MFRKIFKDWPLKLLVLAIVLVSATIIYQYWMIHEARKSLPETPFNAFAGPEDADLVVVEFLDYRCTACRHMHGDVSEVVKNNPDVKFVFRHFPVFGPPSVKEARLALAAGLQGKFNEMHHALMVREQPVTDQDIVQYARQMDIDYDKLIVDMKSWPVSEHLLKTLDITEILGIHATPTFVINGNIYFDETYSVPDKEKLQQLIDDARDNS